MKLKIDANGNVVTQGEGENRRPVYVRDDGSEVAFDAPGTVANISRLNREAQTHREAKEAAEAMLKPFKDAGIVDPVAAANALQTVKNLDSKKLVDAGEVEKVRQEAIKATEERYAPILAENGALKNTLIGEKIGGSFARSKFIAEKCAVPADIIQARFGNMFTLGDDGKVTAKDASGNVIYSKTTPGTPADFDEALEYAIEQYPNKAQILKGSGANGSGSQQNHGASSDKGIFNLPPRERMNAARNQRK